MQLLLPRNHFECHPEWFRVDEAGSRTPDLNLCPSSEEALGVVEENAEGLARQLAPYMSSHRYFLWSDNSGRYCHCEWCDKLSPSDQALMIYNGVVRGLRRVDEQATQSYLAYEATIAPPSVVSPEPGIFLEYAPINRDSRFAMDDSSCCKNVSQAAHIEPLLEYFGRGGSQVLEYWMDNSRFYDWQEPFGELPFYSAVLGKDVDFYRTWGFESVTSFAVGLNADYAEVYGDPPVQEYGRVLRARRSAGPI